MTYKRQVSDKQLDKLYEDYKTHVTKSKDINWIIDEESGEIVGYQTKEGADTIFPFKRATVGRIDGHYELIASDNTCTCEYVEFDAEINAEYIIGIYTTITTNYGYSGDISKIEGCETIAHEFLCSIYGYGNRVSQNLIQLIVKATESHVKVDWSSNGYSCFIVYKILE